MLSRSRLGRSCRGFTIVEVSVAVGIGLALFLVLTQTVVHLAGTSTALSEANQPRRQASAALADLRADLTRATVCNPYGDGAALAALRPNMIQFYADTNGDSRLDLVTWRLAADSSAGSSSGVLQRGVLLGTGSCAFGSAAAAEASTTFSTVVGSVRPDARLFRAWRGADEVASEACPGTPADALNCRADRVAVSFTAISTGDRKIQVAVNETFALHTDASAL